LLTAWGPCKGCAADLDDSGAVDARDLVIMLEGLGAICGPMDWATVLEQAPDPAIVTSASLRQAIVATGYPWRVRDNATQIEMVLIPPGTFAMGCSPSSQFGCVSGESPVHAVFFSCAFYMGRFEVTQLQWAARMGYNPSFFQEETLQVTDATSPDRPVEGVSWNMAQDFLKGTGMRLPSEAEWEYAYRAGTTTAFHGWPAQPNGTNDDSQVHAIGWIAATICSPGGMCQTRPVGGKAPNGFGLHDMAGNVSEWVGDWWSETYYAPSPMMSPTGPESGSFRVFRGGSFAWHTDQSRASRRLAGTPTSASSQRGFRVVRNP
jgi:formylglycine-generating enzyme required for sulfatase activity